jgi:hypothetical protein
MVKWVRPTSILVLVSALIAGLPGCGGGGGGGGGGGPFTGSDSNISFLGFSFRAGDGQTSTTPAMEDDSSIPATPGAGLNEVVIFHFSGVPSEPIGPSSLPVYTTPADVTDAAGAPAGTPVILAKGTYVLVGNTVEFQPFIPSAPLQISLSSPADAVPGLLPDSTYTVFVSLAAGTKIGNLKTKLNGVSNLVQFGTTSNPAAYYPTSLDDSAPPALLAADPADGSTDFFPGVFSLNHIGTVTPKFPSGPSQFELTFDRAVIPTQENIVGSDLDGDGTIDTSFYLSARVTPIVVSQTIPANVFGGHAEFPALSGLLGEGEIPAPDGSDIFLQDSPGGLLPSPDAGLFAAPDGLAAGRDASLLFTLFKVDGGNDLLSVADYVSGDPSAAVMAEDATATAPQALDTGLDDLVGITTLVDGRLVGFDRTTQRIYELLPEITRRRPSPEFSIAETPLLLSLGLGDGVDGFMSDAWNAPVPEVLDLAQAPSGVLYALAILGGDSFPSIIRLTPIDLSLSGTFGSGEGVFTGDPADVILALSSDYAAMDFVSETELLALNRTDDSIDHLALSVGKTGIAVFDVAAFGEPLASFPDGLSPAKALSVGQVGIDAEVSLSSNDEQAVVVVKPMGILPFGTELTLYQRNNFTSLAGRSEVNADLDDPRTPIGGKALLIFSTASPLAGMGADIDDVFLEGFDTVVYEDEGVLSSNPKADWATPVPGGGTSSGLRASVGVSESAQLGDFLPVAPGNFDPDQAYLRTKKPWAGGHLVTDHAESLLDLTQTNFELILLDTDNQQFPLPSGATPGVLNATTVLGGRFSFRDFIIPEGVHVVVRGSNPLVITATGKVEIHGVLDVSGTNGLGDDSFDSAFLPVRGGPPGPGAGRGGDGQPSLYDPLGPKALDQYVTPEAGERGFGPTIQPGGGVSMNQVGGYGGVNSAGYKPNLAGFPLTGLTSPAGPAKNTEYHRSPGGGGGSFYLRGSQAPQGSGTYLVQSESTWFPFDRCPTNNKITDAAYGNEERKFSGTFPNLPIQCLYMTGTPENPVRFQPGGLPGDLVFSDGDADNDYIGEDGELPFIIGGQGGGGGGSRVDSLQHGIWGVGPQGLPEAVPPAAVFYPSLNINGVFFAPSLFDAKGGAGGGGGGGVMIRSFSSILVGRTGHIDASGGSGGGGEVVQNSNIGAGGGGGSGGAIVLQAATDITIEADASHMDANFIDTNGGQGAALDVSGGFGRDAQTDTPDMDYTLKAFTWDSSRSDGGQGGFGLIQLQSGDGSPPTVEEGAFLFAWQRSTAKYGGWNLGANYQDDHDDFPNPVNPAAAPDPEDELRYIDLLHYRQHSPATVINRYYVLNGSFPPIISSVDGSDGQGLINEFPSDSGEFWSDTTMMQNELSQGDWVVRDPKADVILSLYDGYNLETMVETNPTLQPPGTLYDPTDAIPYSIYLNEPDGTPKTVEVGGEVVFDPANIIDRLPVIHPDKTPPSFGTTSVGVSRWLNFNGVATRLRDGSGRPPPFFAAINGTYNASGGEVIPPGKDGQVVLSPGGIPGKPLKPVKDTAGNPLLDGLPGVPLNDLKVDSPDFSEINVVSDNATVTLEFQGAYPIRPGSEIPDTDSTSGWVADLTELTGMPLVRFRMTFDVGADPSNYPFGLGSYRPQADYVRMRTIY